MPNIDDFEFLASLVDQDFNLSENRSVPSTETLLDESFMLRVEDNSRLDVEKRAFKSACWAYDTFMEDANEFDWYVNAAFACVKYDLVSPLDGQSLQMNQNSQRSEKCRRSVELILNTSQIKIMFNCICVAKIYWWLTGNHPDLKKLEGVVLKFAKAYLDFNNLNENSITRLVSITSRWASTRKTLQILGLKNIIETPSYVTPTEKVEFPLIEELKFRLSSLAPAGAHRHAIAHEILSKMIHHFVFKYTSLYEDAKPVLDEYRSIQSHPVWYHLKSKCLTNQARSKEFNDNNAEELLGRLGSFIFIFFPHSTLVTSSFITSARGDELFKNFPDYDSEFFNFCKNIRIKQLDMETVDRIGNFSIPVETLEKIAQFGREYLNVDPRSVPYLRGKNQPYLLPEEEQEDRENKIYNVYDFLFDKF
jgi:hypothetical protein